MCGAWGDLLCALISILLPAHGPIKGQVGLLQSPRKSLPLLITLPVPPFSPEVQNKHTQAGSRTGLLSGGREDATNFSQAPLLDTVCLDSLEQTPNAPYTTKFY